MKQRLLTLLTLLLFACTKKDPCPIEVLRVPPKQDSTKVTGSQALALTTTIPKPDHIVFVWFENKGYPQIVGSSYAPYINSLIKAGTLFTADYANYHPSYPNYVAFFSGSTQGITSDNCISGQPFSKATLYSVLKAAGVSFEWQSESMPANYYTGCSYYPYVERHNPTTVFKNSYNTCNKVLSTRWSDTNYLKAMPRVICVTPNVKNDMHDGSISTGDTWLKNKFGFYANWAKTHNSVLVVYWDEDNKNYGNRIPVVAVGQQVKAGYQVSTKCNHYSWAKTLCALYGASTSWSGNISNAAVISGFWK